MIAMLGYKARGGDGVEAYCQDPPASSGCQVDLKVGDGGIHQ